MAKKSKAHESEKESQVSGIKPPRGIFLVVTLFIPVLFFVLVEVGLRFFSYGFDYTQWVNPIKGSLILNPDMAHKYFHQLQNVPYSNGDIFDEVKKPNAFRIFVLGESSGAGYPYMPVGSFSRYLQQRLSLVYPESRIEVVNCSMTAINSYTLRDLTHGILQEKPDLIIVYAGHNEYYGALGVGSQESLGSSRTIINLVIFLEQFRTFQLVRNAIDKVEGMFAGNPQPATGTLMSRMAQDQYIGLHSKVYENGLAQFEGNMRDILSMANHAAVPVILGTLACNLKDQSPFVSIEAGGLPAAEKVFQEAQQAYNERNRQKADSLFRYAKDLDALRFRGPSDMNEIILKLAKEFHVHLVDIDSVFGAVSPDGVVGDNLMTDHLHPTLHGYQLMGDFFYREMEKDGFLPSSKPVTLDDRQQDSATVKNFLFTKLDSTVASYRIKLLKNDWPYISKKDKLPDEVVIRPHDHIDSIAADLVEDKTSWEAAHRKAARWYAGKNEIGSFLRETDVLISQYPIVLEYYDDATQTLLQRQEYDQAYGFLFKRNNIQPTAFSTKWLGIINLHRHALPEAKNYLNKSIELDQNDSQVWYDLAGVYVEENNYQEALEMTKKALALSPHYTEALALQTMLEKAVK